ncbi:MAG: acetyl-CoA C-acyltransferase [Dehalococcoidales bacterium]|nr:acetyl-CoA C-acyltransferase [Dehalococcoidales bacterium]
MKEVVIASGVRTAIGAYCGMFREVPVEKLAAITLNATIKKAGVKPEQVDDVVMSQAYANGEAPNLARRALLDAGWPVEVPGLTLDRRCCSGLQAIWNATMEIQTEYADIMVAAGAESMSRAEFYVPGEFIKWGMGGKSDPKWGTFPRGHGSLGLWGIPFYDRVQRGRPMHQPTERFGELNSMMTWAEAAAKNEGITREEVDKWALRSHQKAIAAWDSGKFKEEVVPVTVTERGKETVLETDETPRRDTSIEQLTKLRPVYAGGVCTAGNSSSENDGAAAMTLMTVEKAKAASIKPLASIVSFGIAGADPTLTYPAVPIAVNKALKKAGISINEVDLIEVQEAFAAQTLADLKLMGLKAEDIDRKVNVNGSGISLGHPIGATGVMRMVTLVHEMARRNAKYGLLTICGGGGLGIAGIVQRK